MNVGAPLHCLMNLRPTSFPKLQMYSVPFSGSSKSGVKSMHDKSAPLIVGLGGTTRSESSSELALRVSLEAAQLDGAETLAFGGRELMLPMYSHGDPERTSKASRLISALRRCDGLIIASPAYHGGVSGLVKNALDYAEDLGSDERSYFDGLAVGLIACAAGWQGAVQTLSSLRAIVHSLRAWPTPFGATINTANRQFDVQGNCTDATVKAQLETVGRQVVWLARMRLKREP
jgi:FMN reductase